MREPYEGKLSSTVPKGGCPREGASLLNKFYLEENGLRSSPRNIIVREMLVNTLMHREFTSTYRAKFVIEKDRMYTENANRASRSDVITPDNIEPDSKNPIIAAFFRNIGYADSLGSGIRNLYKYVKLYSGKDPLLIEGDVFKIIVPLDDNYSYDVESFEKLTGKGNGTSDGGDADETSLLDDLTASELKVYKLIIGSAAMTTEDMAAVIGVTGRTIRRIISKLVAKGYIKRVGGDRDGRWVRDNR
jgi:ATP-dependent DNA helicase RecG